MSRIISLFNNQILEEGQSFGELALINDDCIRTASIVADSITSVIVIHKDLYNRSVGKIISQEYQEKLSFVENHELFRNWPTKWKKHLAASINRIQVCYPLFFLIGLKVIFLLDFFFVIFYTVLFF